MNCPFCSGRTTNDGGNDMSEYEPYGIGRRDEAAIRIPPRTRLLPQTPGPQPKGTLMSEQAPCRRCGRIKDIAVFCVCVPQAEIDAWFAWQRGDASASVLSGQPEADR